TIQQEQDAQARRERDPRLRFALATHAFGLRLRRSGGGTSRPAGGVAHREREQQEQDNSSQYADDRGHPPLLCRNRESPVLVALGYRALDRLARAGLYEDAPVANADREHVHRPGRGPTLDLAVAVVQRPVARAVESAVRLVAVRAGRFARPRHRTAQVRPLLPQRQEALGHARDEKLALDALLDVPHLVVAHAAREHGPAESPGLFRPEEGQEARHQLAQ